MPSQEIRLIGAMEPSGQNSFNLPPVEDSLATRERLQMRPRVAKLLCRAAIKGRMPENS
jgi:hypothetical protein